MIGSLLRLLYTSSKSGYLLILSIMKSNNNPTWDVLARFLQEIQSNCYLISTMFSIKMRTQLKWIFINKIKDVHKETKLSEVQTQDESGMILLSQAEFCQKNAYKHENSKRTWRTYYTYERFCLFRFFIAEMI